MESLTVEIPLSLLREAVEAQVRGYFAAPDYGRKEAGEGYHRLKAHVRTEGSVMVASGEVRDMVREEVRAQLPGAIRAAVGEELTKVVKAEIARQRKEGAVNAAAAAQLGLEEAR